MYHEGAFRTAVIHDSGKDKERIKEKKKRKHMSQEKIPRMVIRGNELIPLYVNVNLKIKLLLPSGSIETIEKEIDAKRRRRFGLFRASLSFDSSVCDTSHMRVDGRILSIKKSVGKHSRDKDEVVISFKGVNAYAPLYVSGVQSHLDDPILDSIAVLTVYRIGVTELDTSIEFESPSAEALLERVASIDIFNNDSDTESNPSSSSASVTTSVVLAELGKSLIPMSVFLSSSLDNPPVPSFAELLQRRDRRVDLIPVSEVGSVRGRNKQDPCFVFHGVSRSIVIVSKLQLQAPLISPLLEAMSFIKGIHRIEKRNMDVNIPKVDFRAMLTTTDTDSRTGHTRDSESKHLFKYVGSHKLAKERCPHKYSPHNHSRIEACIRLKNEIKTSLLAGNVYECMASGYTHTWHFYNESSIESTPSSPLALLRLFQISLWKEGVRVEDIENELDIALLVLGSMVSTVSTVMPYTQDRQPYKGALVPAERWSVLRSSEEPSLASGDCEDLSVQSIQLLHSIQNMKELTHTHASPEFQQLWRGLNIIRRISRLYCGFIVDVSISTSTSDIGLGYNDEKGDEEAVEEEQEPKQNPELHNYVQLLPWTSIMTMIGNTQTADNKEESKRIQESFDRFEYTIIHNGGVTRSKSISLAMEHYSSRRDLPCLFLELTTPMTYETNKDRTEYFKDPNRPQVTVLGCSQVSRCFLAENGSFPYETLLFGYSRLLFEVLGIPFVFFQTLEDATSDVVDNQVPIGVCALDYEMSVSKSKFAMGYHVDLVKRGEKEYPSHASIAESTEKGVIIDSFLEPLDGMEYIDLESVGYKEVLPEINNNNNDQSHLIPNTKKGEETLTTRDRNAVSIRRVFRATDIAELECHSFYPLLTMKFSQILISNKITFTRTSVGSSYVNLVEYVFT